ncbi:MAG: type II secretion system protein [Sporolactobacillus sp.]
MRKPRHNQLTRSLFGNHQCGIFLTEAIFSVLILTTAILSVAPMLLHIEQERIVIDQRIEAISLLRRELLSWRLDQTASFESQQSDTFQLIWEVREAHQAVLSVHWSRFGKVYTIRSEARR